MAKSNAKGKKKNLVSASAIVQPSMEEEVKRFKAIFRHITAHDLPNEQKAWFKAEPRMALRRLAPLGIDGNQAAIAGYCQMGEDERRRITKAILSQKIGANPKAAKIYNELDSRQQGTNKEEAAAMTELFKKARIAGGAVIRWKRNFVEDPGDNDDEAQEQEGRTANDPKTYRSRLLACTRCGASQETAWMQLRTKEGFRAIHCKACKLQERCINNRCQCDVIWHHCTIHRVDPSCHRSRKAPKKPTQQKQIEAEALQKKGRRRKEEATKGKGRRRSSITGKQYAEEEAQKERTQEKEAAASSSSRTKASRSSRHRTCSKG